MSRTSSVNVKTIIEVDDDVDLTPFITAATALVTKFCADFEYSADPTANSDHLELIERWLAAHFYTNLHPRATLEQARVQAQYQSKVDLRLNTSHYGQTAMLLDFSGALAAYNNGLGTVSESPKKIAVGIAWLGTEEE